MEVRCKGERQDFATGVGRASYSSGFKIGIAGLSAWDAASSAANAALAIDLAAVQARVCKDLCETGCSCRISLRRLEYYNGPTKVDFIPASTFLGLSWGGTWIITKGYEVTAECWRQVPDGPGGSTAVPGAGDVAPVTADTHH